MNSPGWQVSNLLLEINGEITQEKIKRWSQSKKKKKNPVGDVTGDGSKVQWWKEQYCKGTWNVRSMNQGEQEVVHQEMARVNIDISGISELETKIQIGEFNTDDHYTYYCWQESLRRNGVAIIVNKRVQNAVLMQSQKRQNDLCSFPRQTIQYHSDPSLCPYKQC